jgi:hypothetical protein
MAFACRRRLSANRAGAAGYRERRSAGNSVSTVSVNASGERGLLGVAFDPGFASNNFIYIYCLLSTSPIH